MWLARIRGTTSDGAWACIVIILAVAAVNLWKLAAGLDGDPVLHRAGLSVSESPGILPGEHTLDPGDGYVVQAPSRAAADSWLKDDVPYWNRFEGVGAPLAGEMQSMAFHPFVLLQRLPQGFLLGQILMESIAGIATMFFLRRLGIGRAVSLRGDRIRVQRRLRLAIQRLCQSHCLPAVVVMGCRDRSRHLRHAAPRRLGADRSWSRRLVVSPTTSMRSIRHARSWPTTGRRSTSPAISRARWFDSS